VPAVTDCRGLLAGVRPGDRLQVDAREGRVQRFRQALQPEGIARPAWMVLSRLLALLGEGPAVLEARAAFRRMARATPALEGLTWDGVGLKGRRADLDAGARVASGAGEEG